MKDKLRNPDGKTSMKASTAVSWVTVIALTLIMAPLVTMSHEIGGHALSCAALGGQPTAIGAYYVDCDIGSQWANRLVAMAGTFANICVFAVFFGLWLWAMKRGASDLLCLALWFVFIPSGLVAAGYWAYSGVTGMGDWGPGPGGGVGPLEPVWLWRIGLAVIGIYAYYRMMRLGSLTLGRMIGGGPNAQANRKRIALGFYFINGCLAVLVSLLNPEGFVITLTSAIASSFGGLFGMFSIARAKYEGDEIAFRVTSTPILMAVGIVMTGLFAVILGPTINL
ncbi:hypothetical protein N9W89_11040 [Hellea sp.]|nr:hypothetical protein [Hellea sp.]